ncbi:hypothetical protein NIES4074_65880 (plasmid) [Cylindrospermum sp. NIES-4074]|nr:hypothetical protein NIES4074_63640 [Cylindrospermum sp. NIES-4074]BAZ34074.1 hypothetical protein NIES4074_65880 [Cylindrospermum sp. NIES-4074]
MSIWIVTTGNSDVILKHDKNWGKLHDEASDYLECLDFASAFRIDPYDKDAGYTVPARVLGLVYANQSEEYYKDDLKFPLLDTFCGYLTDRNINIERIIILLTDQSQIFSSEEQRLHQKSPYWKDTCTLKPLLEWYFQPEKFTCQPEFEYLTPRQKHPGVDNWDVTLSLVEAKFQELDIDVNKEVYVSHQAGTPAISSAIQFVTLGRFNQVHFLVSNEYFDENDYQIKSKSDKIESSRYQRGMQIQKAKQLLNKGLPAAAKEILTGMVDDQVIKEINEAANLFNLNNSLFQGRKFDLPSAVDRIITALDLIEIFFKQENYIQGVALLNATQETFLKVALLSQVKKIESLTIKLSDLLSWNEDGLKLKSQQDWEKNISPFKPIDILKKLNFPAPKPGQSDFTYWESYTTNKNQYYRLQRNSKQLEWLIALRPDFIFWSVLDWSCKSDREKSDDLRNQLLHNLLGVSQEDAIKYLVGYEKNLINLVKQDKKNKNLVLPTYQDYVKKHFIKALKLFGLWKEATIDNQLENRLNDIANLLL